MDESDFEGTLVLERLAAIGEVDAFFDAVDSDDLKKAAALMKAAGIDRNTLETVLRKMAETDGEP